MHSTNVYINLFNYAPNFEKVGSILVSACVFVRSFVCSFVRPFVLPSVQKKIQARVLKFHIWIPRQKIASIDIIQFKIDELVKI